MTTESPMQCSLAAIKVAVEDGATIEQKAHGVAACRAILAALGAEVGKPIAMPGVPAPNPLAGIDPGQAIDLLIAKLSAMLPKEDKAPTTTAPATPARPPMRIAFVAPPARAGGHPAPRGRRR